jgi:hypothetical protein
MEAWMHRAATLGLLMAANTSAEHIVERVCDPAGLALQPPECWAPSTGGAAVAATAVSHLPNKFGGSSTVGQCVFGHPEAVNGIFGGAQSCWTGALFGFSGVDGACPKGVECTNNQFVGWFVNGTYSLWINTPTPRSLRLGFGADASADEALDNVLVATNDVLLVQRGASRLGLTWLDWRTIVGFVEGPDAQAQLEELTGKGGGAPAGGGCAVKSGCCNAVKQFSFPQVAAAKAYQFWRWEIGETKKRRHRFCDRSDSIFF